MRNRIQEDIKLAMKARDKEKLDILRFLSAAIKQKEVDERRELEDAEVLKLIQGQIKKRNESVDQFQKGARMDLVEKEKKGIEILQAYLPKAMDESEVEAIVIQAVKDTGASGPKDMGKVMKEVMGKTQGRADGKMISDLVRKNLPS